MLKTLEKTLMECREDEFLPTHMTHTLLIGEYANGRGVASVSFHLDNPNLVITNSRNNRVNNKLLKIIKDQLEFSAGKGLVIMEEIDYSWQSILHHGKALMEDLANSGIAEKVQAQYIKLFELGADRLQILEKGYYNSIYQYNKYLKTRVYEGEDKFMRPVFVLVNDNNLVSDSSFNKYCSNFIRSSAKAGIFFIVCMSNEPAFKVPGNEIKVSYSNVVMTGERQRTEEILLP